MSKTFRPYEPEQNYLMPVSLKEWLPTDHLVYFLSDIVDQLDLSEIMDSYEQEERGYPPYHPRMMVKVLLYAYCIGVPSSRKIAGRLEEDIAFRVLAANNTPDFPDNLRFSEGTSQGLSRFIFTGTQALSEGRTGKAGACCPGRYQDQGQRFQTQGHEL